MSGVLEAFTSAVGEAVNELSGFRFTRLTANVVKGAATFPVETTFGWPTSGKAVVDGVVYAYTGKTPTSITGVTFIDGVDVVVGAKADYVVTTPVVDFSRSFSAIDQTVRQFFVDTATGENLSIVGRNVGVDRPPGLEDDDVYRRIIKALAYTPKGTIFAIEAALTAFFGAGNFEVWENFPTSRNTVFIRILGNLFLATSVAGQAYLTRSERRPLNVGLLQAVLQNEAAIVRSVRLAPERVEQDFDAYPTTLVEVRYDGDAGAPVWTYDPAVDEPLDCTIVDGRLRYDGGLVTDDGYFRPSRILPDADASFEVVFRVESNTQPPLFVLGATFKFLISDGEYEYGAEVIYPATSTGANAPTALRAAGGIVSFSGNVLSPIVTPVGSDVSIRIEKRGDIVHLFQNGAIFWSGLRSTFPVATTHGVRICKGGSGAGGLGPILISKVFVTADSTRELGNRRGTGGTVVDGDTVDLGETFDGMTTDGRVLRIFGGTVARNNDAWVIVGNPTPGSGVFNVSGTPERQLAIVESAFPTRVRIAGNDRAFRFPDDIGKLIDLTGAQTAPNPGSYAIAQILDPVTLLPYTGTNVEHSGVCVVSGGPGFVTETQIPWKLLPAFAADTFSWELTSDVLDPDDVTVTIPAESLFSSPPPVGYVIVVEVFYSQVVSAQLLAGRDIDNVGDGYGNFDYYPFYLPPNPLGPFVSFLDDLTVAGVIPEVTF